MNKEDKELLKETYEQRLKETKDKREAKVLREKIKKLE